MLIAEFAKATALSRDTVRFYIRKGLLTPEVGLSGTNRYQSFDSEQVDRALLIREAQSLGFTLREIGSLSEEYARGDMTLARQLALMRERLAAIDEQAEKLERLRQYFAAKVEWLEAGAKGEPPSFSKQSACTLQMTSSQSRKEARPRAAARSKFRSAAVAR